MVRVDRAGFSAGLVIVTSLIAALLKLGGMSDQRIRVLVGAVLFNRDGLYA